MTQRPFTAAILAAAALSSIAADGYVPTLCRIVEHNPSTIAARKLAEAETMENMTGLNLENPEVEFSYQWGSPGYVPDKKTLDVSQSFDFATLSGNKKGVAKARNEASLITADVSIAAKRAEVDALMTRAVYLTRLARWYDEAKANLTRTREVLEKSMEMGNASIVEVNSVKIEERTMMTSARLNQIDLDEAMATLRQMAGSGGIDWDAAEYMPYHLPSDFNTWSVGRSASDPSLSLARANVAVADKEISLRKSEGLPDFSLGYTSEMVTDANYYGVSVGVSLPLWGNSGRVKAARAAKAAAEAAADDAAFSYLTDLRVKYDKAVALNEKYEEYCKINRDCDIRKVLEKQYEEQKITVREYLEQIMPLLNMEKDLIDAENEYQEALVELRGGYIEAL